MTDTSFQAWLGEIAIPAPGGCDQIELANGVALLLISYPIEELAHRFALAVAIYRRRLEDDYPDGSPTLMDMNTMNFGNAVLSKLEEMRLTDGGRSAEREAGSHLSSGVSQSRRPLTPADRARSHVRNFF